ncbi:amidohydrolase family protein [Verminephrobacter aporrectodeae]|uniref:2-pyrone-4,6-dicarboxylate hydrolase n=1 Tax=Verminephrobacter aporrectodeae subsp. tuberculatae TaxID=1110392 RepID=A0ABT3KV11_9BURK|nr:amidohydrolase family protein [Verminephrobacter aporrectodeae]MCW5223126.1 2-pyrone-4,6-dicarboxylate hydrolase [Verminephrobacter aporrectodeae subsp. tuberculatae]MCW5256656.1 2-pyrone-4,6-dicarboxylate hydrolase [Verminephrobacter aporrectodeae subsp. tuberculatae]MCW5288590.1 2-pyrone-4,6-dicarboxylate hydrolase [Verminephrobacter aporrectodeae subsp. tuberculatae]MCW5322179.1 2-pyrone-4,6-dicarboxylate hydrolase [Verminephrobacter aporrectodeae subsp. tuberculatae]MCW8164495.1 2-pyron
MTDHSTPGPRNPPPHPNPGRPTFRLPPGACDAHCHVFGPAARFPYSPQRSYEPTDAPAAQLRALHALLGVERAVLVQASVHGHDNRAMLDAIAQSPGNYRGVAMVPASISDAGLQALHGGGVRALRFNFVRRLGGAPDLDAVRSLAQRVHALGWHLVLHFDPQDLPVYRPFLDALPLPYVIDHMGRVLAQNGLQQAPFEALLALMRDPRCWVKLSGAERTSQLLSRAAGLPFADAVPFARRLIEAAPERVLWGTDWPHPSVREMPDDGKLVDLLPLFSDDAAVLQQLLVDNPGRLYWPD